MRERLRALSFKDVQQFGFSGRTHDRKPNAKVPQGRVRFKGKTPGPFIEHAGAAHGHFFENASGLFGQANGLRATFHVFSERFAHCGSACKKRNRIDRLTGHFARNDALQTFGQRRVGVKRGRELKHSPETRDRGLSAVVHEKDARILRVVQDA